MPLPRVERGPCKEARRPLFGLVSPSLGQLISRNTNQNSSSKSPFISFQISSLKTQIQSQESDLKSQEDDLNRAKSELNRLQQEETQLEQSIQAGKVQLETIIKSLKSTQDEINQVSARGQGLPPLAGAGVGVGCGFWGLLPSRGGHKHSSSGGDCAAVGVSVAPAHLIHIRFSPREALFSLKVKC